MYEISVNYKTLSLDDVLFLALILLLNQFKVIDHIMRKLLFFASTNTFLQLIYLMLMTSLIPLLPWANVRRWIYNWSALTCFRILSRSLSAVITFHNRELRPKTDGICVANHTTPIDVFILSCDKTYALVRFEPQTFSTFFSK